MVVVVLIVAVKVVWVEIIMAVAALVVFSAVLVVIALEEALSV